MPVVHFVILVPLKVNVILMDVKLQNFMILNTNSVDLVEIIVILVEMLLHVKNVQMIKFQLKETVMLVDLDS